MGKTCSVVGKATASVCESVGFSVGDTVTFVSFRVSQGVSEYPKQWVLEHVFAIIVTSAKIGALHTVDVVGHCGSGTERNDKERGKIKWVS